MPAPPVEGEAVPRACRPLYTTSAGLTEPGVLEVEAGAQGQSWRGGVETASTPLQLNLGLTRFFDVRLAWGGALELRPPGGGAVRGGGDLMAGGQALFAPQERLGVDLGLAGWHTFPRASAERGLGSGHEDDTLLLTSSWASGAWNVDLNAGATWRGRGPGLGRARQGTLSCALTWAPAPAWNLSLDTYVLAATELGPRSVSSILALSRDLGPDLILDAGIEAGLTRSAPRLGISLGLVWRFDDLRGRKHAHGHVHRQGD